MADDWRTRSDDGMQGMQQSVDDETEEAEKAARNTMSVLRAELNQVHLHSLQIRKDWIGFLVSGGGGTLWLYRASAPKQHHRNSRSGSMLCQRFETQACLFQVNFCKNLVADIEEGLGLAQVRYMCACV